jgi:hypothetical protein
MRAAAGRLRPDEQPPRPPAQTAPLTAVSGALRRRAYAIPEHHARHWMLLLLADRVELAERRLAGRTGAVAATALGGGAAVLMALARRLR